MQEKGSIQQLQRRSPIAVVCRHFGSSDLEDLAYSVDLDFSSFLNLSIREKPAFYTPVSVQLLCVFRYRDIYIVCIYFFYLGGWFVYVVKDIIYYLE